MVAMAPTVDEMSQGRPATTKQKVKLRNRARVQGIDLDSTSTVTTSIQDQPIDPPIALGK